MPTAASVRPASISASTLDRSIGRIPCSTGNALGSAEIALILILPIIGLVLLAAGVTAMIMRRRTYAAAVRASSHPRHVHEAAVVALERDRHRGRGAVPVFGHDEVRLPRTW